MNRVFASLFYKPNEPVEKVTFLKTASSAGSKIENYFLPSKVLRILGAMFLFSWSSCRGKRNHPRMKAIFECTGQDLSVKVDRYELALRIIKFFVSRHPVPPKRSPLSLPLLIWRFYHAFKTFSTASTMRVTGIAIFGRFAACHSYPYQWMHPR